jgi:hypothetical protein
VVSLVLALITSASCVMPAQVRPPRTLDAGRFENTAGLRLATSPLLDAGVNVSIADMGDDRNDLGFTPVYALRYGLNDWLELGGEVGLYTLRMEVTAQLIESRGFDLTLGYDFA